jgi:GTP-binding protein
MKENQLVLTARVDGFKFEDRRRKGEEFDSRHSPPGDMSLDQSIEYFNDDELLEVTPLSLRIRKRTLDTNKRGRADKRAKEALGA